jgi:hypothetical protein
MPTTSFASLPRMKKHRRIDGYIVCSTTSRKLFSFLYETFGVFNSFPDLGRFNPVSNRGF